LRRRLGVDPDTPFVVGHTPLSPDDTLWLDAGGIENHHVLFGAIRTKSASSPGRTASWCP
jgi:hypothetical protein